MRTIRLVVVGILLAQLSFTSCTCQQQVEAPLPVQNPSRKFPPTATPMAEEPTLTPTAAPSPTRSLAPTRTLPVNTPAPTIAIPDDFPAEVPVYKDAAVAQVQELANDARNVIFHATDPIPDIADFYHDKMLKQGWKLTQSFDRENHAFATFKKGNTLANITIAADAQNPDKNLISIMYEEEKQIDFDEF